MAAAGISKTILAEAFVGICEFRFHKGQTIPTGTAPNQNWDYKVPTLKDSVKFDGGKPTFTSSYLNGQTKPLVRVMDSTGEIAMSFIVPSIDEETTGWLANAGGAIADLEDTRGGVAGKWIAMGTGKKGIILTPKPLSGIAMVVSQDEKYAILFKNLNGFATPILENSTTPLGFQVDLSVTGITSSADSDVVFLKWTPN